MTDPKNKRPPLKHISLLQSITLFGLPGLVSVICFYYITPALLEKGVSLSLLFPISLWIGVFPLFPLALLFYRQERKKGMTLSFRERFRLTPLRKKDILWALTGILLVALFDFVIMEPVGKAMAKIAWLSPPAYFPPLLNPLKEFNLPLTELLGFKLEGNWFFLTSLILIHLYMMFSEEIMWRGYILPRQEVKWGKWAWLINGLFWAWLVHAMMRWAYLAILPGMLITPFIAWKTKNTWVSLIIHAVPNSIIWILVLLGVLGVK